MLDQIISAASSIEDGDTLPEHPNRVVQADVDGIVYHTADTSKSLKQNFEGTIRFLEWLRQICCAKFICTHTTMYLKGGRAEMAYFYPYQKERGSKMLPELRERVNELRRCLHNYQTPTVYPMPQWYVEADDSMTRMQNEVVAKYGDAWSSIIATGDKDLRMASGLHYDLNTKKFSMQGDWDVTSNSWINTYGKAEYVRPTGKSGKLSGRGTAVFWAQMLGGDTADTIKGVPRAYADLVDTYTPLTSKKRRPQGFQTSLGMSLACKIVSQCPNDLAAYRAVASAYRAHFKSDWQFFFFENAFLLWMRRTNDALDVLHFLEPLGFKYELHSQQKNALQSYYAKCIEFNKQNNIGGA